MKDKAFGKGKEFMRISGMRASLGPSSGAEGNESLDVAVSLSVVYLRRKSFQGFKPGEDRKGRSIQDTLFHDAFSMLSACFQHAFSMLSA